MNFSRLSSSYELPAPRVGYMPEKLLNAVRASIAFQQEQERKNLKDTVGEMIKEVLQ